MSQGKERHKLSGIFAQATIAHLGVAKLALDAPDRVFRFSADAGLEHALQCLGPVHKARDGVHADVRFHPKVPLLAFPGLMHFWVARLAPVLGRTRRVDQRGIDDRTRTQHQPLLAQQSVDLRKHLFPKIHGTAADRTAFLPSPHLTDRTTAAKSAKIPKNICKKRETLTGPFLGSSRYPPVEPFLLGNPNHRKKSNCSR